MHAKFTATIEHLEGDLATLQVGRATPTLIENIKVEAYDSLMPLQQLASITNQDAQTLLVQPWDMSVLKPIEKALYASGQNLTPIVDGNTIRVPFPPLTEEKRHALVKTMHQMCQDAHVQIKRVREELLNDLKKRKKEANLSEDAFVAEQKQLQKLVDDYNAKIDALAQTKQKNLLTI